MTATRQAPPARNFNPAEFAHIAAAERDFWWFRGMDRMLWQFLKTLAPHFDGRAACEVGCGTGWISEQFRERYPRTSLVSMDIETEGLRYARERGLHRLTQGDIRHLPFPQNSFQLLLVMDVIAHMMPGEEKLALAEFSRVLAPGGVMVLRASAFDCLRSKHSEFVLERQRYTLPKLLPLLADNHMKPLRTTYANSVLMPVAFAKFRIWEPIMGASPESGLQGINPLLNRALEMCLRMEARWLTTGGRFPAGQSLWIVAQKEASLS